MNYWLLKSEPASFGIDDLAKAPRRTTSWDGVRNYQARNMLRDQFKKGDLAFFYHSSCDEPGIYGVVRVVRAGYPDATAFERGHHHYDPDSKRDDPRWFTVDVQLVRRFAKPVLLTTLAANRATLSDMVVLRRGNRLSVMPVTAEQWARVLKLAGERARTRAAR
jgi:predicted RNA-binding protein with PUA-like domain